MEEKQLRDLQITIFEIFCEVDRICRKEQIPYFIIAGTALGAVRHGGFIPWDDDLDIGMKREDYERFLQIASKELNEDYFLQNHVTDPNAPFYFTKIRKNGTRFVEHYLRKLDMHHGVFVDIFPFDSIPDEPKIRQKFFKKAIYLHQVYVSKFVSESCTVQKGTLGAIKSLVRKTLYILLKPISKEKLFQSLDQYIQQYHGEKTEMRCYVLTPKLCIKDSDLNELEEILFEGKLVMCPANITHHLSDYFGDYMNLPPESKRVGHKLEELKL